MKELEALKDAIETLEKCETVGTFAIALENVSMAFKELEATLSPRLIEEAPEEWFDGRSVLVWDDEYERTFIGMFVSPLGWVVDERGLDSLTQLHCVTKVLPLPSMDGGEK